MRSEAQCKRGCKGEAWEDRSCLLEGRENEAVGGVWLGHLLRHFLPGLFFIFFFFLVLTIGHCSLHLRLPHILILSSFLESLYFAGLSQTLNAKHLGRFYQGQQEVGWDCCLTWLIDGGEKVGKYNNLKEKNKPVYMKANRCSITRSDMSGMYTIG